VPFSFGRGGSEFSTARSFSRELPKGASSLALPPKVTIAMRVVSGSSRSTSRRAASVSADTIVSPKSVVQVTASSRSAAGMSLPIRPFPFTSMPLERKVLAERSRRITTSCLPRSPVPAQPLNSTRGTGSLTASPEWGESTSR